MTGPLIGLGFMALLAVLLLFSLMQNTARAAAERDHLASNKRCLDEFKDISLHRPRHIVDVDGADRRLWDR